MPGPDLNNDRRQAGIERCKINRSNAPDADAMPPATPASAAAASLAKRRDGYDAGDRVTALSQLASNGEAVIDGQKREPGFPVAGPVFHDGGANISTGQMPRLSQIGHA